MMTGKELLKQSRKAGKRMYKVQIIRQRDADASVIDRVIALKQKAWPYPKKSQLAWIEENLKSDDLHLIMMQDGIDVAYLNLCNVKYKVNGIEMSCKGIGNVCSTVRGAGYGLRLMTETNEWLVRNKQTGLLFCHANVEQFYVKCGWVKIDMEKCVISGINPDVLLYAYNMPVIVNTIEYSDRLF